MGSSKERIRFIIYGLILLALVLIIWEWAVRSGRISRLALPVPSQVIIEGARQLGTTQFLSNWYRTLTLWVVSLGTGLSIGLLLGFSAGVNRAVALTLLPLLGYLRSIPPIALFPVALIALGPGNLPIGVVASLGATLYVFPGTAEAARETSNRFSSLARILGSNKLQFLCLFVAPGAAVHALASSRVAATYAFAVCVAGEMIVGGRSGVGAAILDFSERYQLEIAYAYILFTGIVGITIDLIFRRIVRIKIVSSSRKEGSQ